MAVKRKKITPREALQLLIDQYGSVQALSREFGLKAQSLWTWVKNGEIPMKRVLKASQLSKPRITPNQFRPDIYPE